MREQKMKAEFPQSSKEVLDLIARSERSRKFAWTAGRVLMKGALQAQFSALEYNERKLVLERLNVFLEELASRGILQRRAIRQGIGYGQEIGFDYTLPTLKSRIP